MAVNVPPPHPVQVLRLIARLNMGGPAKHVAWLCRGLAGDFDTTLAVGRVPPNEEDLTPFARQLGVQPQVIDALKPQLGPWDALALWRVLWLIWRLRPQVLHTHTAKAGFVGRAAALFTRPLLGSPKVVVHTFHGHVFHGYWGPRKTRLFLAIERFLARRATDAIVVLSPLQQQEISEQFGVGRAEQFHVIPLGLDLSPFLGPAQPAAHPALQDKTAFRIGSAGRLTAIKDYPLALEGLAGLGPGARLFLAGEGEERAALLARAQELGVGERVHLTGALTNLMTLYPWLDVFVLTSRNEGTPLAMLEAMAAGVPVAASRVGGVPDLLGPVQEQWGAVWRHERGVSFPPQDAPALTQALAWVRQNPAQAAALAQAARQQVVARYGVDRLVADVRRLYEKLLKEKDG